MAKNSSLLSLSLLGSICIIILGPRAALAASPTTLEAAFTTVANGWERVERWRDTTSAFTQEAFPPDGRGDQTGQRVAFFGNNARPHSSLFLLYYAPGWNSGAKPIPVLLVHGANQTADLAWANPNDQGDLSKSARNRPERKKEFRVNAGRRTPHPYAHGTERKKTISHFRRSVFPILPEPSVRYFYEL